VGVLPKLNIENQVHFVTVNTIEKLNLFTDTKCREVFIQVLDELRNELKYKLLGYVIMLNHIHLLIQLRVGSDSFEKKRVGSDSFEPNKPEANSFEPTRSDISYVVKRIKEASARKRNTYLKRSGKFWQKGFYDFNIYSEEKFVQKLNYIHNNPVQAGLINNPKDWLYPSFQNYYSDNESVIKIDRIEL